MSNKIKDNFQKFLKGFPPQMQNHPQTVNMIWITWMGGLTHMKKLWAENRKLEPAKAEAELKTIEQEIKDLTRDQFIGQSGGENPSQQ